MKTKYLLPLILMSVNITSIAKANLFDEWAASSTRGVMGNYTQLGLYYASDRSSLVIDNENTNETTTDNTSELLMNFSLGYEFKSGFTLGGKFLGTTANAGKGLLSFGASAGYFYGPWFAQVGYLFYANQTEAQSEFLDGTGYTFDFAYMFQVTDGLSFGPMFSYLTTRYDRFLNRRQHF